MSSIEPIRLSKRMTELAICSRREADYYIKQGWVKVNGVTAILGQKVLPSDRIDLDKIVYQQQAERVTILLNKPVGFVSEQPEKNYRAVIELITSENHWKDDNSKTRFNLKQLKGLVPAGRLDIDSVGLLVLTQDGRIAKQIIDQSSDKEKEYLVRVQGKMIENGLALLNHGLSLDGEKLRPAKVQWQNESQLRFILKQGKKRQIRRMCELVGLKVVGLKRVRIGQVKLGQLPIGQWRYLGENERF